jgi:hypothetical protein
VVASRARGLFDVAQVRCDIEVAACSKLSDRPGKGGNDLLACA